MQRQNTTLHDKNACRQTYVVKSREKQMQYKTE